MPDERLKTIPDTLCEIEVRIDAERGMYKLTSIITEAHPTRWAREEEALGCAYPWAQQLCEYERSRGKKAVFTKVSIADRAVALRMEDALKLSVGEQHKVCDDCGAAVPLKEFGFGRHLCDRCRPLPQAGQVPNSEGYYTCANCGKTPGFKALTMISGVYLCDLCAEKEPQR